MRKTLPLKIKEKSQIFFFCNTEKQMEPCKSNAKEFSYEWSHYRISSTDSQVTSTLHF